MRGWHGISCLSGLKRCEARVGPGLDGQASDGVTLAVVSAQDGAALAALARPLPHYGRQSYVVFDGAKVTSRGAWPAHPQAMKLD